MHNANPDTIVSWADFLVGYGPWARPSIVSERDYLPGHNSSYKRAVLLEYGDALATLMEAETVLMWDLRAKGIDCSSSRPRYGAHELRPLASWVSVMFQRRACVPLRGRTSGLSRAGSSSRQRRRSFRSCGSRERQAPAPARAGTAVPARVVPTLWVGLCPRRHRSDGGLCVRRRRRTRGSPPSSGTG